jgi:hypothetical protein
MQFFQIEDIVNRMLSSSELIATVEVENSVFLDFSVKEVSRASCEVEINAEKVTVECNFGETDFAFEVTINELRKWVAEFCPE